MVPLKSEDAELEPNIFKLLQFKPIPKGNLRKWNDDINIRNFTKFLKKLFMKMSLLKVEIV